MQTPSTEPLPIGVEPPFLFAELFLHAAQTKCFATLILALCSGLITIAGVFFRNKKWRFAPLAVLTMVAYFFTSLQTGIRY